ncbi:MAG: hypothetical protein ACREO5_15260, partial [Candidatus Binatia bacterium]
MADKIGKKREREHFYLKQPKANVFAYSPKLPPIEKKLLPKGQRQKHANQIKAEIATAIARGFESIEGADAAIADPKKRGFYLEIRLSDALGFIDGLENATKKIFIKNISVLDPEQGIVSVVVYVPEKSADHYKKLADRYAAKTMNQRPTTVDEAIAHIDRVKQALFEELYTDAIDKLPRKSQTIWWE